MKSNWLFLFATTTFMLLVALVFDMPEVYMAVKTVTDAHAAASFLSPYQVTTHRGDTG